MRKLLSFLSGLFFGIVTGGVLGLLFAPKSGVETKQGFQDYVKHLVDEGKSAAETRRLELEAQLEAFKQGQPVRLAGSVEE